MYTDEYGDEQEEVVVNNNSQKNSGFNIKIVIIAILLLVIIGIVVFIFQSKNGNKNEYVLNIKPDVISMSLGKTQNIAYDVRKGGVIIPDAIVQLEIEDDSIARIDNTVVTGLNFGKTRLIAKYISDTGKTYESIADVVIAEGDPNVMLASVTFPNGDLQMSVNGIYKIELITSPPNGYIESKVITSSDSNIVSVESDGTLKGIGVGVATITIDINNGLFKKDINVSVNNSGGASTVSADPISISLSRSITSLNEGDTATLKYTITPSNASTNGIKWKSSDTSVLTVSNGKLKAIKEGSAVITITTSNNISDSVTIQVNKKSNAISKIDFPMNDFAFLLGQSQLITPTITPSDITNAKLTYTSSDSSVVSVTPSSDTLSATIKALTPGSVVLTIRADNGVEKKINVYVIG